MEAVARTARARLAEAARRTGLHRSTAHHLLQTLVSLGYLRQDAETRGYELAAKPFQITGRPGRRTSSPRSPAAPRRAHARAAARVELGRLPGRRGHRGGQARARRPGARGAGRWRAPPAVLHRGREGHPPWLPSPALAGLLSRDALRAPHAEDASSRAARSRPSCGASAPPATPSTTRSTSRASAAWPCRSSATRGGARLDLHPRPKAA